MAQSSPEADIQGEAWLEVTTLPESGDLVIRHANPQRGASMMLPTDTEFRFTLELSSDNAAPLNLEMTLRPRRGSDPPDWPRYVLIARRTYEPTSTGTSAPICSP